jgi:hypothetical protein
MRMTSDRKRWVGTRIKRMLCASNGAEASLVPYRQPASQTAASGLIIQTPRSQIEITRPRTSSDRIARKKWRAVVYPGTEGSLVNPREGREEEGVVSAWLCCLPSTQFLYLLQELGVRAQNGEKLYMCIEKDEWIIVKHHRYADAGETQGSLVATPHCPFESPHSTASACSKQPGSVRGREMQITSPHAPSILIPSTR